MKILTYDFLKKERFFIYCREKPVFDEKSKFFYHEV